MATTGTYKGVDVNAGTDAEVAAQVAKIDAQSTTPKPLGAIPVSAITTPVSPAKVTPPVPSSATAGLQGAVQASQDAFTQGLAEKTAQAQASLTPAKDAFTKALLGQTTAAEETNKAYAQTVDPAEAELKKINQQILADQVATRHQIEDIQKNNPNRVFGTGMQQEIQKIQDESTRRQADLAVIQLSKQGQYDSAKAIADRAVAALVEGQKNKLQALQFMYEDNKDLFTKAEQRQFESAQADRNRKLDDETYKERARFDQILKQNDPLYLAQLRKAQADAQAAVTPTGGVDVNNLSTNGLPASKNNSTAITSLIANSKIGQGTKTQLANVLGVINAAQALADNNVEGKFKGINPLTGILSTKVFGVGLPFRETVKSAEQIQNEGYIEAINLRTQIWASGASLTKEQIAQVNRFTPRVNDTDANVQAKLNSLTNFMLNQTKSQLQSEGVEFTPAKVDLFETAKLIQQASPEQKAELKAAGLIK